MPGHVHLKDVGEIVGDAVRAAGGVPREFHTIAVDDGIAMGHGGMLYSLPSRELIADSVECMVNAHTADALVCISNCDKITPGMLNAAMRRNIPTVFVSGGPMEAGKAVIVDGVAQAPTDLITAISASASDAVSDEGLAEIDAISRSVPCLAKVSPNSDYHMEDVHRAGGIPAILGELNRAGLLEREVSTVHSAGVEDWLGPWDIRSGSASPQAVELFHAAPGGVRTGNRSPPTTAGPRWTPTPPAGASVTWRTPTPPRAA